MRHLNTGRKLSRSAPHRKAMLRSMTLSLIEKEEIRTTPPRAKELRWFADRVVTWAKRGDLHSRRQIVKLLGSTQTNHSGENRVRNALEKLYSSLAPRFKDRPGGYTQMIRLAHRRQGDNAELCVFRYLPDADKTAKKTAKGKAAPAKKAAAKPEKKAAAKEAKDVKETKTAKTSKAKAKKETAEE
ncbi:50S ribosomal protein L17 [bacterium]|nr:50S ribosomal protein L17 [bacterium]